MEKYITVAVAGHVDHGKTTLVRALTGIDTDRMDEEKRRGMSIESGVAPLAGNQNVRLALVDVPGHKDFLKNTIRGLSCVDLAILVVAADDGVMPQTQDHLEILSFFGAAGGMVVVTKSDLVDTETLELAELEARELVSETFLDGKSIVPFSSKYIEKADVIHQALIREAERVDISDRDLPCRLWIDQTRHVMGFGTIVSGTLLSGILRRDDPIQLMPSGQLTRARFIESHGQRIETAQAGQRIGINLHKVTLDDVARGMLLCLPGLCDNSYLFNVELRLLRKIQFRVKNRMKLKLYIGTLVTVALVVIMEGEQIHSGESALVQLRLSEALSISPGDRFAVSLMNEKSVIGGGVVLEVVHEKFTRSRSRTILPGLMALRMRDAVSFIESNLDLNINRPLTPEMLHRRSGIPLTDLERVLLEKERAGQITSIRNKGFIRKHYLENLKSKMIDAVRQIMSASPLKRHVNGSEIVDHLGFHVSEDLVRVVIDQLLEEKRLYKEPEGFRLQDHKPSLSGEEEMLSGYILDYADQSGRVPFSASRFIEDQEHCRNLDKAKKMLHFLHHQNRLIRLTNKRFIAIGAMEDIKCRIERHIREYGHVSLADSQDILGYGRTMAVPVFEYLDLVGFTRRRGDERVLAEGCGITEPLVHPSEPTGARGLHV